MVKLSDIITGEEKRIAIAGHVSPDGDCVGSCGAVLLYLSDLCPQAVIDLYLEEPKKELLFLPGADRALSSADDSAVYDLMVTCDVSNVERIGVAGGLFDNAVRTVCIDHHISNTGFAQINHIVPDASSCAEVLYDLMEPERVGPEIAEALYTGMIHDTGVFQYQNTSPHTLRIAADLLERGIPFQKIIDESFNLRSYRQNRILGHVLARAELFCGDKVAGSCVSLSEMEDYGVTRKDLDIVVSQLRMTEGIEAAVFVYETEPGISKGSLRSNSINVSGICAAFGGGGHERAAGCTVPGEPHEVLLKIVNALSAVLSES